MLPLTDRTIVIEDCGLEPYTPILRLQHELHRKRRLGRAPNTILLVEHTPVITLGARQSANKLLADRPEIERRGIEIIEIRRGGGTTAHNPGQLVIYPVLSLADFRLGISEYIRTLELIGSELLTALGVPAGRRDGFPGLWIAGKKIASIGVRVSRGVTFHGMAVNIKNDLTIFDYLIPCGLEGIQMTSVAEQTNADVSMSTARKLVTELLTVHFSQVRT